jgi:ribosome maturation factor RimP
MAVGTQALEQMLAPVLEALGLVLYHLEWSAAGKERKLVLVVDRADKSEGGVSLDELTQANRELSALLDLEDPIEGNYRLVVESPGLERSLKTPRQFLYACGERVRLGLRRDVEGKSDFEGVLKEASEGKILLDLGSQELELELKDIKSAQTVFVWSGEKQKKRKFAPKNGE